MTNKQNKNLITEVGRIKELMLLTEQPIPFIKATLKSAVKMQDFFSRVWDDVFIPSDADKSVVNTVRNRISSNPNAVDNITNNDYNRLLRSINPASFSNFAKLVLDAWGVTKTINDQIVEMFTIAAKNKATPDFDTYKTRIISIIDSIPNLNTIDGLRDEIIKQLDEVITLAQSGKNEFLMSRGLYSLMDLDYMYKMCDFNADQVKLLKKYMPSLDDKIKLWLKDNNDKNGLELFENLTKYVNETIDKLNSKEVAEKLTKLVGYQNYNAFQKALNNLLNRFSIVKPPPDAVWSVELIFKYTLKNIYKWVKNIAQFLFFQFILVNIYDLVVAGIDPHTDYNLNVGATGFLIGFIIRWSSGTTEKIRETVYEITIDEVIKFISDNQQLNAIYPKKRGNDYSLSQSQDKYVVKMINFDGPDPNYIFYKKSNGDIIYQELPKDENKSSTLMDQIIDTVKNYKNQ